jgi:hypothetical protein
MSKKRVQKIKTKYVRKNGGRVDDHARRLDSLTEVVFRLSESTNKIGSEVGEVKGLISGLRDKVVGEGGLLPRTEVIETSVTSLQADHNLLKGKLLGIAAIISAIITILGSKLTSIFWPNR